MSHRWGLAEKAALEVPVGEGMGMLLSLLSWDKSTLPSLTVVSYRAQDNNDIKNIIKQKKLFSAPF